MFLNTDLTTVNEETVRAPKRIRLNDPVPVSNENDSMQRILKKAAKIITSNDLGSFRELADDARYIFDFPFSLADTSPTRN